MITSRKLCSRLRIMKVNKQIPVSTLLLFLAMGVFAQPSERRISKEQYISNWKEEAIYQMHQNGIPASITLAQGILESAYGNSELAKYGNNHFGIKCHVWDGPTMFKDDDHTDDCFRVYASASESFKDHSEFLTKRGRYAFLFELKSTDYKGWARGLKKAGYATNPRYAHLLIDLIEEHHLYIYDKVKGLPTNKPALLAIGREIKREPNRHRVGVHENKIKYIVVSTGDTFWKIAKEFDMGLWQLYKYNDLEKNDILQSGDIVFLQPKRRRGKSKKYRIKNGDTLRSVSQDYGIKLKALRKKNHLEYGSELKVGTFLSLK